MLQSLLHLHLALMLPETLLSTRSLLWSQIMPGGCSVQGHLWLQASTQCERLLPPFTGVGWFLLTSVVHPLASPGGLLWMAHWPAPAMSMSPSGRHSCLKLCLLLPSGLSCIYFPASVPHLSEQMGIPNEQILNANSLSSETLSSFLFLKLIYHFLLGQRRKMVDLFQKFVKLDKDSYTS